MAKSRDEYKQFYSLQKLFLKNGDIALKDMGLGFERKLMLQIIQRCHISEPWTWTQTGTQKQWAEQWGMTERTLKRYLKVLRESEMLICEVRRSNSVRKNTRTEFPVFTVPFNIVLQVANWNKHGNLISGVSFPSQVSVKCQNGTYTNDAVNEQHQTSLSCKPGESIEIPMVSSQKQHQTSISGVVPISNSNSNNKQVTDRISRRLRQRKINERQSMRNKSHDDGPPVLGQDPDRKVVTAGRRTTTPASKISEHFIESWDRMRMKSRDHFEGKYARMPYYNGHKGEFMGWIKNDFLPSLDGDLDLAKALVDKFCDQYPSNPHPGNRQPFRELQSKQHVYEKLVRASAARSTEAVENPAVDDDREAALARARERISRKTQERLDEQASSRPVFVSDEMID